MKVVEENYHIFEMYKYMVQQKHVFGIDILIDAHSSSFFIFSLFCEYIKICIFVYKYLVVSSFSTITSRVAVAF